MAQIIKCLPTARETWARSLGGKGPLEKKMATHSRILAWKIPWTEEPGSLQSMRSQRVRHNWEISLSFFLSFLELENRPMVTGAGIGSWAKWVKRVKGTICLLNKSWSVMYSVVTIVSINNIMLSFEVAKKVDLKSSHCKKKTFVTMCDNGW